MSAIRVLTALKKYAYKASLEKELQEVIQAILLKEGIPAKREVYLSKKERPDFEIPCTEGKIAIEIKVQGSTSKVISQLTRYSTYPDVFEIILITTKLRHLAVPSSINQKKIHTMYLPSSF